MTIIEQIVIPALFGLLGWFGRNLFAILSYKNKIRLEEVELADKLMSEIADLREKVLNGYKLIDQMEAENKVIRRENTALKEENNRLNDYANQLRKQYDGVMDALLKMEFDVRRLPGFHGAPPANPNS